MRCMRTLQASLADWMSPDGAGKDGVAGSPRSETIGVGRDRRDTL
ncbi:hypothetical protein SAMN06264855_12430 [Halorubrum vacuolatum]|uniref:Uncharacterized protein n=1 Tax=Halorubrum vacuolatum TaxID=63740 RepID=A0A238XW96_HALVU|nr:hypothetical protein SAMN06264855_12430 [Halorubrum vacuolatum]